MLIARGVVGGHFFEIKMASCAWGAVFVIGNAAKRWGVGWASNRWLGGCRAGGGIDSGWAVLMMSSAKRRAVVIQKYTFFRNFLLLLLQFLSFLQLNATGTHSPAAQAPSVSFGPSGRVHPPPRRPHPLQARPSSQTISSAQAQACALSAAFSPFAASPVGSPGSY